LSHHLIIGFFIRIRMQPGTSTPAPQDGQWISTDDLKNYAFPGIINQYMGSPSAQTLF
jgi:hypothetical protein